MSTESPHDSSVHCKSSEVSVSTSSITRISGDISYSEFFERFITHNVPCIFSEDITKSWLSRIHWVKDDLPNFDYLQEHFGKTIAPVANCNENYFGSHKKTDMPISDFLCYWEEFIGRNYPTDMPILYLKDWHLKRDYQQSNYYQVPSYFASDWLNEFWTQRGDVCDDYRFVYMGPKGSWTPEHEDVFSSYSWSANIVGQKRWVLYPPPKNAGLSAVRNSQEEQFGTGNEKRQTLEVIQETGEIIFVPSGWRHEVWNLKDTISINHNWANACNLETWVWPSLSSTLSAVEAELKDCLEDGMECWEAQCQVLLRATHGIDFMEFYSFLRTIGEPRLRYLLSHPRYFEGSSLVCPGSAVDGAKDSGFPQCHLVAGAWSDFSHFKGDQKSSWEDTKDHSNSLVSGLVDEQQQASFKVGIKPQKAIIELDCEGKKHFAGMSVGEDISVEPLDLPFHGSGWLLGTFHALLDLWCIHRVIQRLLLHPSIPKLEFFQKLILSQSHVKFMNNLDVLIQTADTSGQLQALKRFI